jgi:hypothetical protein
VILPFPIAYRHNPLLSGHAVLALATGVTMRDALPFNVPCFNSRLLVATFVVGEPTAMACGFLPFSNVSGCQGHQEQMNQVQ